MFLVSDRLKIAVATGHISLAQVTEHITAPLLEKRLTQMERSLQEDFCLHSPRIAVLGLDPHNGDEGVIGTTDSQLIAPTIARLFDGSQFMEYKKGYGPEMITGLAKVGGLLVGVVANQQGVFPNYPEYKMEKYGQSMGAGGKLYRQGLIKMNEFVTLCARDRIPMIWIQDTTGIDVGDDAEVAELLGLGQSLIYSIQRSKLPMMEITLRRGTAAAHYVLGGPQGNDNNAFSLGTAATESNVMNGKTAANAMYTGRLAKDQKAGKDLQPTIDKMNALIDDYDVKSKPLFCDQAGLVDEVVGLPVMRE